MKTPRILFFQTPRIWLSLLCTAALLLAGCSGGSGAGADSVAGAGLGNSNISVNGQLVPASANPQTVTSGSDDAALINSQRATAPKTFATISFALGSSNRNAKSVKWQFGSNAGDLVDGQLTKTAVLSNGVIPSVTVAFKTAGIKTVTSTVYSTADASGTPLSTETIRMYVDARPPVTKTASITGASSGGTAISNPGQTGATSLTLSGTYSSDLGTDYSVQVFDGASPLGAATLNAAQRTWSYTANNLSLSEHTFTAKVVRTADTVAGKASDEYKVSVGNTLTTSNSNPNIWDEFTLTLSNVWNNVVGVVFNFDASDMADGIAMKYSETVNSAWQTVTTAFKTTGIKTITGVFYDNQLFVVATRNINVTVGANVTQTVTITEVKDGTTSIPPNGTTDNTKPVISGSFPTPLSKYYSLKLYDNGTLMSDTNAPSYTLDGNGNKTAWSFTPDSGFSAGSHAITAKVVRIDEVEGVASAARTFNVSKLSQVAKADGVLYFKTECVKDNNTGLMWEGKPADGTRRGDPALEVNGTFTNIESDSSPANALGYVNAVNKAGLCGFTDWRLPTKDELLGIVDSNVPSGPKVEVNWFPNTKDYFYWTSSPVTNLNYARVVYFYTGADSLGTRSDRGYVRLVRDTQKYRPVPKAGGGVYSKTECVLDKSTGFMWEGKPAAGTKRGSPALDPNRTYTNNLNDSSDGNAKG